LWHGAGDLNAVPAVTLVSVTGTNYKLIIQPISTTVMVKMSILEEPSVQMTYKDPSISQPKNREYIKINTPART
jgi:hypothetical protein